MEVGVDELVGKVLHSRRGRWPASRHDTRFDDGGRFISVQKDGQVISAYYHPTRRHSATAQSGLTQARETASAPAGLWAVATIPSGVTGHDRTFYNIE